VRVLASFDGGKSWKEAARSAGPTAGRTDVYRFTEVPPGARKALVRYELSGSDTIGILSFRLDADYRDPLAARTFRPFDVVYRWKEDGRERTSRTTVTRLPFNYTITTAAVPEMESVTYEMR
jgi:hypothetical protein